MSAFTNPNVSSRHSQVQDVGLSTGDGELVGLTATSPVGFFGTTPTTRLAPAANVHTPAAGATTAVFVNTTFDGSIGSTAYTVGDIVAALKTLGLLA